MNKRANLETIGMGMFISALIVFTAYSLYVYIPALQADMTNADAVIKAIYVGLGCGIFGTIGLLLAKR